MRSCICWCPFQDLFYSTIQYLCHWFVFSRSRVDVDPQIASLRSQVHYIACICSWSRNGIPPWRWSQLLATGTPNWPVPGPQNMCTAKKDIISPFACIHSNSQKKIFQINGQEGLGCALEINISASGRLFRPRSCPSSFFKSFFYHFQQNKVILVLHTFS